MWSGVLGFLCTLIIGYVSSYILYKISSKSFGNSWDVDTFDENIKPVESKEVSSVENNHNNAMSMKIGLPNPDLFTPILARRVRKRNEKILNNGNIQVRNV